ncbi:MAG: hypothetical protein WAV78_51465 [Xanthobacteraceae bacterium]
MELWQTRKAKCLSIIGKALQFPRQRGPFPTSEIELNREFYFCLLTASRELYPDDEIAPVTECSNQPDPDDEARARRELKRPDFQWIYLDRYEPDPQRSSRQFVAECKRLGVAHRPDWILNLNYVNHGILRFRDPDWAYAKLASSGAMIGYWQSMQPEQLLMEINEECGRKKFPIVNIVGAWLLAERPAWSTSLIVSGKSHLSNYTTSGLICDRRIQKSVVHAHSVEDALMH